MLDLPRVDGNYHDGLVGWSLCHRKLDCRGLWPQHTVIPTHLPGLASLQRPCGITHISIVVKQSRTAFTPFHLFIVCLWTEKWIWGLVTFPMANNICDNFSECSVSLLGVVVHWIQRSVNGGHVEWQFPTRQNPSRRYSRAVCAKFWVEYLSHVTPTLAMEQNMENFLLMIFNSCWPRIADSKMEIWMCLRANPGSLDS
jgi:hypothetical protein